MKTLISLLLVSLPVAAQAAGTCGEGGCPGDGHLATVLYAALAALGYWVLQHAWKETAGLVKRTGAVVGMTLAGLGLLGFLCGVGSHIKKRVPASCGASGQGAAVSGMPEVVIRDGQAMVKRGGQEVKTGKPISLSGATSPAPLPAKKNGK